MEEGASCLATDALAEHLMLGVELAVLRAVPGVIMAAPYPAKGWNVAKLNENCVKLKLETENGIKLVAKHCGQHCPTWLEAAQDVKKQLKEIIGPGAIADAEERVRVACSSSSAPAPEREQVILTEAEKEWLAAWWDELSHPEETTAEQATAALFAHRSASAGRVAAALLTDAQLGIWRHRAYLT
jgi:hypothetical protein